MRYTHFIVIGLLIIMALPALGASSYLGGFSGIILTPDGGIVPAQTWEASFHVIGSDPNFGLTYGLVPNLEVGASVFTGDSNSVAVSGKYRLVSESATSPGIAVGVFDVADASFYVLLSKNITPLASDIAGRPSKPLRLGLGFGSGFYNGVILNLDWTLEPQLSLLAEYNGHSHNPTSVGLRWAATNSLRLDVATVGFRELGFGLSYRSAF